MVRLDCNAGFLVGGRGRLYSPILTEFIEALPKLAPIPVVRYTATHVARCIEYEGHADQRGYWKALREEWKRVGKF